jgi:hypothetical protein
MNLICFALAKEPLGRRAEAFTLMTALIAVFTLTLGWVVPARAT